MICVVEQRAVLLFFHCPTKRVSTEPQPRILCQQYSAWYVGECLVVVERHEDTDSRRRRKCVQVGRCSTGLRGAVLPVRRPTSVRTRPLTRPLQSARGPSQYEPADVADWSTTPAEL